MHQSFEPVGFLGAISDEPYKFDLAKAKALLAKAGLANGFSVTMDVRNASPDPEIAQAIQAGFAQAGIKLELIPGDGKQVLTKYRARHHDIFLGEWDPDYPDPHSNAEGFIVNPDNSDNSTMKTPAWRNASSIRRCSGRSRRRWWNATAPSAPRCTKRSSANFMAKAPYVMLFEAVEIAAHRANVGGFSIGVTSEFDRYAGMAKQ